jgi:Do/DeqQ family serine protease
MIGMEQKNRGNMKKIIITLLTACVGGAVAIGAYKLMEDKYMDGLTLAEKQQLYFANNPLNVGSVPGDVNFVQAAAVVTPAVVHINTTYENSGQSRGRQQNPFGDMFDDFFGPQMRAQPTMASGSGVIISEDGYIVTNNHVVEDATKIDVILPDRRSFEAKIIGRDPKTDLALIKVSANNLPIVKLGNSDNVQVGEWVLAVGYPFALNTTVTAGIVSAKGRSIGIIGSSNRQNRQDPNLPPTNDAIESFIQTDAAINRGNSGGALVNTNGELIGINAAIASQGGNYEGYGFAIPINLAKKVLEDFKEFGVVKRGYVGVTFQELNARAAKELGINQINGLYITDVVSGGGAEAAGLKKGDIIVKVDNTNIYASPDLQEHIGRLHPGDKVQLTYLRDGRTQTASVTLKDEGSMKVASAPNPAVRRSAEEIYNRLGASFAPANSAQKQKFRISSGVTVTDVRSNGLFAQMDVPEGMIITTINGRAVNSRDDVSAALGASRDNMIRITGITSDGARASYSFPVN